MSDETVFFLLVAFLVYLFLTEFYESHYKTSGLSSAVIFILSLGVFYLLKRVFDSKQMFYNVSPAINNSLNGFWRNYICM